ncbi:cytochrome P450 [Nannocystis radixulma]|uniref:Cytochrome P450 n=1 Tax=Nannocystis radixulma TaxID=2995305 RepID=A0ABT5BJ38_9BACT|nr:cytochrome P450 [Nannocystis radixulma]MDC0673698.1 cytochrome P450 [Nannocystis radixulma]
MPTDSPANEHHFAHAFNPHDAEMLRDPHEMFERMRREQPVFFSPKLGMWIVSRHNDICSVLRDPARFSSHDAFAGGAEMTPEALALAATGHPQTRTPIDSDPPEHGRMRRIVGSALSGKKVDAWRPRIRELAAGLIDGFVGAGRVDIAAAFAGPFPLSVILDILGIPLADMAQIKKWSDDWFELLFARVPPELQVLRVQSFLDFQQYCERLIAAREANPGQDALSEMLRAGREEQPPLTLAELISLIGGAFIAAGHETTSRMLCGTLHVFLTTPGVWQAIVAEPARIGRDLEEAMRIDSTAVGMIRTATTEVVLGGIRLPAGARLHLLYASGSRDEQQFRCPAEFDPGRANVMDHLGFGRGMHYCVGALLARAEAQIAFELFAERLPGLRLAAEPAPLYRSHMTIRGPVQMFVEWDVA